MTRFHGKGAIFVALAAIAALLVGGAAVAHDDTKIKIERKGKVKIVTEDEHGERHEETIEWDSDKPRPFLGVAVGRSDEGVTINSVIEDSGAERAGLEAGDVLVSIDGDAIDRPWDLTRRILSMQPGDTVELEYLRDGDIRATTAELGEREGWAGMLGGTHLELEGLGEHVKELHKHLGDIDIDIPHMELRGIHRSRPLLGVQLVEPTDELREHLGGSAGAGVLVSRVIEGTPAEDAGVQVGDLIVSVDGEEIEHHGDLRRALRESAGETIDLELIRDRRSVSVSVDLPELEERRERRGPRA